MSQTSIILTYAVGGRDWETEIKSVVSTNWDVRFVEIIDSKKKGLKKFVA